LNAVKFALIPVDNKPSRKFNKTSKYDPILDKFLVGKDRIVTVEVTGRKPNYLRMQLKKRIDARQLDFKVSVVDDEVYLEK
jgi:hypothetical protein